jgi:peptide deformylase
MSILSDGIAAPKNGRSTVRLCFMAEATDQIEENRTLSDPDGADSVALDEGTEEAGEEIVETELDPEIAARRDAALAHVRKFGDPVLKTKARPVERFDEALREEIRRMDVLMDHGLGIGLAATQLGVLHRLLVYRVQAGAPLAALANPVIEWSSKEEEITEEGCLSLPLVHVDVERPVHVRVRAQDEFGDLILIEASGLEARVIQHEIDHLDGVLILDRTSRDQRKEAMKVLRDWQDRQRTG